MTTKTAFGGILVALSTSSIVAQTVLEPAWTLSPGDRSYLQNDNNTRGIAYNPTTDHLLVVSRTTALGVYRLDAATGGDVGTLNVTGISGGTFAASMIGIGSDGAIYAANLTTGSATTPLRIYRWENEEAVPTLVYSGNPLGGTTNARFGDTLDVRGSGENTQILLGSRAAQTAVLLTPTDDSLAAFDSSVITTVAAGSSASNGPFGLGVAFGGGNTFWATSTGVPLRQFDITSGTVLSDVPTGTVPTSIANIGLNSSGTLLAGINALGATDEFRLYDVSNPANPVLLDTETFPVNNANANGTGSVDFGGGRVFALDSNNGLVAFNVVPEPGTFTLLITGALAFLGYRPRSRK